jgi:hypothetical protein
MIFMGASPLFSGDPIPCVPFPLGISEGEDLERGAAPLLYAPLGGAVIVYPAGGAGYKRRI